MNYLKKRIGEKMRSINNMINAVIDQEGGYVNHPSDKGGPTKYGITLETLTTWRARLCNDADISAMKKQEAFEIYYSEYFINSGINTLPEQFQEFMLDSAANHGNSGAIKLLQKTLSSTGKNLQIDGIIGPVTKNLTWDACNDNAADFMLNLIEHRISYYHAIVQNNPSQQVFLAGWLARAESFRV